MVKKPVNQLSPGLQLLYFLCVFAGIFIGFNIIGIITVILIYDFNTIKDIGTLKFSEPNSVPALYLLQLLTMTAPILTASFVFARYTVKESAEYLKTSFKFSPLLLIVVLSIAFLSLPASEYLSNLNQDIPFPDSLKGLQRWLREGEDQAKTLSEVMFKMDSFWDMIKLVFLIGLLTAIAEEFMFRGVIQTIMHRWTQNMHIAVWITAALFSAFHREFFGFLPRLMLGAMFGYFAAWSGSIWPAVWAHFLNNSTIIVIIYLYQQKKTSFNPEDQHLFSYVYYIFSLIIIIILLLVYKNLATGKKQSPAFNGEELG